MAKELRQPFPHISATTFTSFAEAVSLKEFKPCKSSSLELTFATLFDIGLRIGSLC